MKWLASAIINGLLYCLIGGFLYWVVLFVKAIKDSNVKEASKLRMDIRQFNKYRLLYDEFQNVMEKHGVDSVEARQFFKEVVWPKVKNNPNEWRCYQDYQASKYQQEFANYVNKNLYSRNK